MAARTRKQSTEQCIKFLGVPDGKRAPREGSARAKWLDAFQEWDGCSIQAFCAYVVSDPKTTAPSLQPKGKYGLQDKCEPPMGWIKHFVREGHISVKSAVPTKAPHAPVSK